MTPRVAMARVGQEVPAMSSLALHAAQANEAGAVTGQVVQGAGREGGDWLVKVYDTESNLLGAELARADGSFCVDLDRKPVTAMLVLRITWMRTAANDAFANPLSAEVVLETMEAVAVWDGGTVHVELAETEGVPANLAAPEVVPEAVPEAALEAAPVPMPEDLTAPEPAPAPEVLVHHAEVMPVAEMAQQAQVTGMVKGVCVSDASTVVSGKASARVKLPNTRMQGGGTVTAWFNLQTPVSEQVQQVFDLKSRDGALAALLLQDGVLWLQDKSGYVVARSAKSWCMSAGWHHVAIQTTDAVGSGASTCSRWSVWVDGVEVLTQEGVSSFALTLAAGLTNVWRVSLGNCELGDCPMAGWVGGAKIWNAVLTPQEVRDDTAAVLRNDAGLKGCWLLDADLRNSVAGGERAVLLGSAKLVCAPLKRFVGT
ncbi:LamG-like jellyroll fold domain-containing protein [Limnohabitans sp.]|uniref:LamG-like jellyroll fold domain-containing protein n=1 Tax=Limnohabitans sp. TaxID=1907725 RepID=UPI00286EEB1D|nr:LamG-like jellyroll fold domain-containing protein [Limnohabitans sp.]